MKNFGFLLFVFCDRLVMFVFGSFGAFCKLFEWLDKDDAELATLSDERGLSVVFDVGDFFEFLFEFKMAKLVFAMFMFELEPL